MTKVLNLDALSPKGGQRELVLNGKTHVVHDMTVENFIETTRTADRLIKEKASVPEQVKATVEMIKRTVPSVDIAELNALSLEKLNVIATFLRGDIPDDAVQTPDGEGEGAEGK